MIFLQSNNQKITNFALMAERHCGTKFLAKYMEQTYSISRNLSFGHKHFFGFNDDYILHNSKNTLFIGIVRNPYTWIMSMNKQPWHMRESDGHPDPIDTLEKLLNNKIRSFWEKKETNNDRHIKENRLYNNIFELREDKHNYLINRLPKLARNYILINYETLCQNIELFTSDINKNFSIESSHRDNVFVPNKYTIPNITVLNFINEQLIWTTENKLGYYATNNLMELQ
jgi:hypothetical protein